MRPCMRRSRGGANEEFVKRQRTAKVLFWSALLAVPLVVWLLAVVMQDTRSPAEPAEAVAVEVEPAGALESQVPPPPAAVGTAVPPPNETAVRSDPPRPVATDVGQLTMEISPTADCWVQASADGATVISRVLRAGDREVVVAQGAIELRIGDAAAFAFTINQRPGRSLGASGQVLDVTNHAVELPDVRRRVIARRTSSSRFSPSPGRVRMRPARAAASSSSREATPSSWYSRVTVLGPSPCSSSSSRSVGGNSRSSSSW